jgi:acetoin utilization protein AcuB
MKDRKKSFIPPRNIEAAMFVQAWMTNNPIALKQEEAIAEAMELMKNHKIRRLPIINNKGDLLGILSSEDVKAALPSAIDANYDDSTRALANQAQVGSFMSISPVTVQQEDPIENAAFLMQKHKIGGIPVLDGMKLVGIITETDIFHAFMAIFPNNPNTIRLEIILDELPSDLYRSMNLLQKHGALVLALSLCDGPARNRKLLTLRIEDSGAEEIIDAFWNEGIVVTKVTGRS